MSCSAWANEGAGTIPQTVDEVRITARFNKLFALYPLEVQLRARVEMMSSVRRI